MALPDNDPKVQQGQTELGNEQSNSYMSSYMALSPEEQDAAKQQKEKDLNEVGRSLVNGVSNGRPLQFSIPENIKTNYDGVLEYASNVYDGKKDANYLERLGDLSQESRETGAHVVLMDENDFVFNYGEDISKQGKDPKEIYSQIQKSFGEYSAMKKAVLPTSYATLPPTDYVNYLMHGSSYKTKPLPTIELSNNKLYLPGEQQIEVYSQDHEANVRNYYTTKEGARVPLALEKYKDHNDLKMVTDNDGNSSWVESQDGELINASLIRGTTERQLFTDSNIKGFFEGGAFAVADTYFGITETIPFVIRATFDNSDIPMADREYFKKFINERNQMNAAWTKNIDQSKGAFDNMASFSYNLGNGLSQMLSIMATSGALSLSLKMLAKGSGKLAMGIATKYGEKTVANALAKGFNALSISDKLIQKVAIHGSTFISTGAVASHSYDELVLNGIEPGRAARLMWGYMAGTYASEMIFPFAQKIGADAALLLSNGQFTAAASRLLLKETLGAEGFKNVKNMTDKQIKNKLNRVFTGFSEGRYMAALEKVSGKAGPVVGRVIRGSGMAGMEGLEEGIEGGLHSLASVIFNGGEQSLSKAYVDFYKTKNFTEELKDGVPTGNMIMLDNNDANKKEVLSGRDYDIVQQRLEKSKRVLNGEMLFPTGVSLDEIGMATISTLPLGLFGSGGAYNSSMSSQEAMFKAARQEVDKGGVREQISKFYDQMEKEGEFELFEDPKGEKKKFLADFDIAVKMVREGDINTSKRYGNLRGGQYISKRSFLERNTIKGFEADIKTLNSIKESIAKTGSVEKDIKDLGVKKGMNEAAIDGLITKKEAALVKSQGMLAYIENPETKSNQTTDEKTKEFKREKTNDPVVVDGKKKNTSSLYSEIIYNIERQEDYANKAADEALKDIKDASWTKEYKKKADEIKDNYYQTFKDNKLSLMMEAAFKGLEVDDFNDFFKRYRDIFLATLHKRAEINKTLAERFDETSIIEKTRFTSSGKVSSTEDMLNRFTDNLKDIISGQTQAAGGNHKLSMQNFQNDLELLIKELGGEKGLHSNNIIAGIKTSLDEAIKNNSALKNIPGEESSLTAEDESGLSSLSDILGNAKERAKPIKDISNPSDEEKIGVLEDVLRSVSNHNFDQDGDTRSLLQLMEDLKKESEDKDQFKGFLDSEGARNQGFNLLNFIENLERYIEDNIDFVQNGMEQNKSSKEHSPLVGNDNARLPITPSKEMADFKSMLEQGKENAKTVIEKSEIDSINRDLNYNNSKMSSLNWNILFLNSLTELIASHKDDFNQSDRKVSKDIEDGLGRISAIVESALSDSTKIESINDLFKVYSSNKELRDEVNERMESIEAEYVSLLETLSGRTDHIMELWNSYGEKSNIGYYYNGDAGDNAIILDRNATNLQTNKGLLSGDSFEKGANAFLEISNTKTNIKAKFHNDIDNLTWYHNQGLDFLNMINNFGKDEIPTYSQVILEIRNLINEDKEGKEYLATYEQEQAILSIISMMYSPKNDYIKKGISAKGIANVSFRLKETVDNLLYLKGFGGSGKSTVIIRKTFQVLSQLKKGKKFKVAILTPNEALVKTQDDNFIGIVDKDKKDIVDRKFILFHEAMKDPSKLVGYDYVIMEESTVIPEEARTPLTTAIKKSNAVWLSLGDHSQPTQIYREDGTVNTHDFYIINEMGRRTRPLTEVFRNDQVQSRLFMDKIIFTPYSFHNQKKEFFSVSNTWKVSKDKKTKIGIQKIPNISKSIEKNGVVLAFLDYIKEYKEQAEKDEVILIVFTGEDKDSLMKLDAFKKKGHLIKTMEYDYKDIMAGNDEKVDNLVSGIQKEAVFFAVDFGIDNPALTHKLLRQAESSDNKGKLGFKSEKRFALVGTTRHKTYLAIVGTETNAEIEQEKEDNLINGYDNTSKNLEDYQNKLRVHLVGEDGATGRYGAITKNTKPFNEGDVSVDPPVNEFSRNISLSEKGKQKTITEIGEEYITKLKDGKEATKRMSDKDKEGGTDITSIERLRGRTINALTNYLNIKTNGTEAEIEQFRKVVEKTLNEYEDAIGGKINNMDKYIEDMLTKIAYTGAIDTTTGNELVIVAPFLNVEVNGEIVSGQPNIVKIVGYAKDSKGKSVPIVDVVNYRSTKGRKVSNIDKLSTSRHIAALVSMGFKLNKIMDIGLDVNEKSNNKIDFSRIWTADEIMDMLENGNNELQLIKDEKEKAIATEEELNFNEHYVDEHVFSDKSVIRKFETLQSPADLKRYFVTNIVSKTDTKGKTTVYLEVRNSGDYDGKIKRFNANDYNKKFKKLNRKEKSNRYKEQAERFSDKGVLWSTTLGGTFINSELMDIPSIKEMATNMLISDNNLLRIAKISIIKAIDDDSVVKKVLVTDEGAVAFNYDEQTGELNDKRYELYKPKELRYSVLLEHKYIEDYIGVKEVQNLIKTVRGVLVANGISIPEIKEDGSRGILRGGMDISDKDIFYALGLNVLAGQGQVEIQYGKAISSPEVSNVLKDEIKGLLARKADQTKEDAYAAIYDFMKKNSFNEKIFETDSSGNEIEVVDNYKEESIRLNTSSFQELWSLINEEEEINSFISSKGQGRVILNDSRINDVQYVLDESKKAEYDYEKDSKGPLLVVVPTDLTTVSLTIWRFDSDIKQEVLFKGRIANKEDVEKYIESLSLQIPGNTKQQKNLAWLWTSDMPADKQATEKAHYFSALRNSDFMQFLGYNTEFIREAIEADTEVGLYLRFNEKRGKSGKLDLLSPFTLIKDSKKIIQILQDYGEKVGYDMRLPAFKMVFDNKGNESVQPILENLVTRFKTLSQPDVYTATKGGTTFDMRVTGEEQEMIPDQAGIDEMERISGKVTNSNTFFNKGIFKNKKGEDVWGNIRLGVMTLSSVDGYVSRKAVRHESMHKVMINLLDPVEYAKVMLEAEKKMRKDGVDLTGTTNEKNIKINEYIANQFMSRKPLPKTYLGKAIKWLKDMVMELFNKRDYLDSFFDKADIGFYSGRTSHNYNDRNFDLNMKKEKLYSDEDHNQLVKDIFLHARLMNGVISNHIIPNWIKFSPYGRDFNISEVNWHETLSKMKTHFVFFALKESIEGEIIQVISNEKDSNDENIVLFSGYVDEMETKDYYNAVVHNSTEKRPINEKAIRAYEALKLSDSEVLLTMLQAAFPSLDIELLNDGLETIMGNDEVYDKQNILTNPMDSKSQFFAMTLSTIPYYSSRSNRVLENRYVNFTQLNKLLIDVYTDLQASGNDNGFSSMLTALEEKKKLVSDPQTRDIIGSFLREYGTGVVAPESYSNGILQGHGYYNLRNISKRRARIFQESFAKQGRDITIEEIIKKSEQLRSLLTGLDSYYSSMTTLINTHIEWNRQSPNIKTAWNMSERVIRSNIKNSVASSVFQKGTKVVSRKGKALVDGTGKYQIKANGDILKFNKKEEKYQPIMEDSDTYSEADVLAILHDIGLTKVTSPMVHLIFGTKRAKYEQAGHTLGYETGTLITKNELYRVATSMLFSLKVNFLIKEDIDDNSEKNSSLIEWSDATVAHLETYNKMMNDNFDHKEIDLKDIQESYSKKGTEQTYQDNMPSPDNFWKQIENYFAFLIRNEMNELTSRMTLTVEGQYAYSHPTGSYISDMIPTGIGASETMAKGIRAKVDKESSNNPLYDKETDTWNNPALAGLLAFDYYDNFDGITIDGRGVKYFDLTGHDLMKTFIEGMILNSAKKGHLQTPVLMDTYGDRPNNDMFHIHLHGHDNKNVSKWVKHYAITKKGEDGVSRKEDHIEINRSAVVKAMTLIAKYHIALQKLATANYNKVKKLGSIDEVLASDAVSGRDYIIQGDKVLPGNAVDMVDNHGEKSPYIALSSILSDPDTEDDAKYQKILEEFSGRYDDFTNYLDELDYKLPVDLMQTLDGGIWQDSNLNNSYLGYVDNIFKNTDLSKEEKLDKVINDLNRRILNTEDQYEKEIITITENDELTDEEVYDQVEDWYNKTKKGLSKEEFKDLRKREVESIGKYRTSETAEIQKWNPLLESAFFMHTVFNDTMNPILRGSQYFYGKKGTPYLDFLKRAGIKAPGIKYTQDVSLTAMGKDSRVLFIQDIPLHGNVEQEVVGGTGGTVVTNERKVILPEIGDGSIIIPPWTHNNLKLDSGGGISSISEGMIKNVQFEVDHNKSRVNYLKAAMMPISPVHHHAPFMQDMLKLALGEVANYRIKDGAITDDETVPTLLESFRDDFIGTRDWFTTFLFTEAGRKVKPKLIDYFVYQSSSKTNNSLVHKLSDDYDDVITNGFIKEDTELISRLNNDAAVRMISNKHLRLQQVTSQDTVDQNKTIATQILFIAGVLDHNKPIIQDINNALAEMSNPMLQKLNEIESKEDAVAFIRELGKEKSFMMRNSNRFLELIEDDGLELNVFRNELSNIFANELREYTLPNMPGQNYIQAPYYGRMWMDTQRGIPYMEEDVLLMSDAERATLTPQRLRHQNYEKNGEYSPTQIVIPFNHVRKFGIDKNITLIQSMTVITKGEKIVLLNNREDAIINAINEDTVEEIYSNLSLKQRGVIDEINQRIDESLVETIINYFITYNESLKALGVRIPTSNASSAFSAVVVGFDHTSSNTVYVPVEKSIWDGSDYDIDALSIYFKAITKDLELGMDGIQGSQNKIFDSLERYYNNTKNQGLVQEPIDMSFIINAADSIPNKLYAADITSSVKALLFGREGSKLVGHFANLENAISRILSLPAIQRQVLFPDTISGFNTAGIEATMAALANLINAATDNETLGGALGLLNINVVTSQLIAGLVFKGYTLEEIVKIVSSDEVLEATKKAVATRNKLKPRYTSDGNIITRIAEKPLYTYLTDKKLKNAALMGEGIRRLSDVSVLQRKVSPSSEELWQIKTTLEFVFGRPLAAITEKVKETLDPETQIKYVQNNSSKKIVERDEKTIRNLIKIDVLLSSPIFKNIRNLVDIYNRQYEMNTDVYFAMNEDLRLSTLNILGINNFYTKDAFKKYAAEVDKQNIGWFLSKKKVSLNDIKYDLGSIKGRYDFVTEFPDWVRGLKDDNIALNNKNEFIREIAVQGTITTGGNERIEMNNVSMMPPLQHSQYQGAFNNLSPSVKNAFEIYNMLVYGMSGSRGSMGELITNKLVLKYSKFLKNKLPKLLQDEDTRNTFAENIVLNNPSLLSEVADNGNTEKAKGKYFLYKDDYQGFIIEKNTKEQIGVISSTLYNVYTQNSLKHSGDKTFLEITKDDLDSLKYKGSNIRIHQKYTGNVKKESTSGFFDSSDVEQHYIIGSDRVLLPNGSYGNLSVANHGTVNIASTSNIKESRIKRINSSISNDVVDVIIDRFQKSFPNIKIVRVNNAHAVSEGKSIAWIEGGVVYLNEDKIQTDTLMHEFIGHIFVDIIEEVNPLAFASLASEAVDILNNTEEGKLVANRYSDFERRTLVKEVIANMIGWNTESDLEAYLESIRAKGIDSIKRGIWERIRANIARIRGFIMEYINKAFGVRANVDITTASLKDLGTSALNALKRGDVITYMSSDHYDKLNRLVTYEQRDDTIKIKNVMDVLEITHQDKDYKKKEMNGLKRALVNNSNEFSPLAFRMKQYFQDVKGLNINELSPEVIYEGMLEYEKGFSNDFLRLLKMPNPASQENLDSVMPKNRRGKSVYSQGIIKKLLRSISYDVTTKYYRYSEFIKKDEYRHFASKELEGYDPIIGVEVSGDGTLMLNIFDITPNALKRESNNSLFAKFAVKGSAKEKLVGFFDNQADRRRFAISLLFNHILAKDKNANIRNMAVINLFKKQINSFPIDPNEVNHNLDEISKLDEFMGMLDSEDITNVLNGEKYYPQINAWESLIARYKATPSSSQVIRTFLTDDGKSIEDKANILLIRLREINSDKNEEDEFSDKEINEITLLQNALEYVYLIANTSGHENPLSFSVGNIEAFTMNSDLIGNIEFQKMKAITKAASAQVSKNLLHETKTSIDVFYKRLFEIYKKDNPVGSKNFREIAHKVWGQINATILDDTNNEVNIGAIYWTNKTDDLVGIELQMAERAKELGISQELLDIGNDVVEYFESQLKRSIFYKKYNNTNADDYWNYEQKRLLELNDIDLTELKYFRGMMPLMPESSAEAAAKGKIGKWFKKKLFNVTDLNEIFDFANDKNIAHNQQANELLDMFFWQFGYNDTGPEQTLGAPNRTKHYLGLTQANLVDPAGNEVGQWKRLEGVDDVNSDINLNLSRTLKYFIGTVERKQAYETQVLPMMNSAKILLAEMIKHKSNPALQAKLKSSIKYINSFTKQAIKQETDPLGHGGVDTALEKVALASIRLAAPLTMFINLNIASIGAISNLMFAAIEAGKNSLIENGIFNAKDLISSNPVFIMNNFSLIKELMVDFQVMNMTEVDLLNSMFWREEGAKLNPLDQFNISITNWAVDYFARATVMVAQMKHDGSWDAYSINDQGEVVYDHSKNRMYRSKNGKQTEDQKILEDSLSLELVKEGGHNQTEGELPIRGYTNRTQQKLRAIADHYVTGAYTTEDKAIFGSIVLGRLVKMFKTYTAFIFGAAFAKQQPLPLLGNDVVVLDKDGNKVVRREAMEIEGYLRMIWRQVSLLRNDGWKKTREGMTTNDRRNWKRLYMTVGMYTLLRVFYSLMVLEPTPGDEPDDKIGLVEENRIIKNFKYAGASLFGTMVAIDWILHPFASIDILTGYVTDPLGRFDLSGSNYPFKSQMNTMGEITGVKDE